MKKTLPYLIPVSVMIPVAIAWVFVDTNDFFDPLWWFIIGFFALPVLGLEWLIKVLFFQSHMVYGNLLYIYPEWWHHNEWMTLARVLVALIFWEVVIFIMMKLKTRK